MVNNTLENKGVTKECAKYCMQSIVRLLNGDIKKFEEYATKALEINREIEEKLVAEDNINVEEVAENLLGPGQKEDYRMFMARNCDEEFTIDKKYVEKKLKRVRLKIDKDIDLYINQEAYKDASKFEIQRNGDGSINMIIKNVVNYIEK